MSTAFSKNPNPRPLIGVQITGFFRDPFQTAENLCILRIRGLPEPPARSCTLDQLKANLSVCGADLLVYHVNPFDLQAAKDCNSWAGLNGFQLALNNEMGQLHGDRAAGWRGWNWDPSFIKSLNSEHPIYGLIFDELMHNQVHPSIPSASARTNPIPMVAPTETSDSEAEAYDLILNGLKDQKELCESAGSRFLTEEVTPIFFHAIARAGGVPGCKILKEQNSVLSITLAMSAAWQYETTWTGCIDLWEGDSGPWYQIMSKFSGHSPSEFRSALEMTYLLNPECLYVESSDILWECDRESSPLTGFGREMAAFSDSLKNQSIPLFDLKEWEPEIAVIHIEDGSWGVGPWDHYGLMGSDLLPIQEKHLEWMKIWYHLMWGQADPQRLWEYQNPFEISIREKNLPGGHELDVSGRPDLDHRNDTNRKESHSHRLFHPLNNTVVLDQHCEARHLKHAKLIIVVGSYAPETLWPIVEDAVRNGATCLCQKDIAPESRKTPGIYQFGEGTWRTIDDFLSLDATNAILPFRGSPQQWRLKTTHGQHVFFSKDPWGNIVGCEFESSAGEANN